MSTPPLTKSRRLGDALHLSGELGFGADGAIPEGITAQTENTIDRIEATLKAEGLTLADVVSATCYLTDKADFAAFNAVYAATVGWLPPFTFYILSGCTGLSLALTWHPSLRMLPRLQGATSSVGSAQTQ